MSKWGNKVMASERAERFMSGLQDIEESGDVAPLVEQFADDATLSRLTQLEDWQGKEGAQKFWSEYLSAFGEIHSTFSNVVEEGDSVILEWESKGSLPAGQPLHYRGVSVLEFDGERVQGFRTYYDSAAFVLTEAAE